MTAAATRLELGNPLLAWLTDGLGTEHDPIPMATATANLPALMDLVTSLAGTVWIEGPNGPVALSARNAFLAAYHG